MRLVAFLAAIAIFALLVMRAAGPEGVDERLARYRNLGKAFYENPTTQNEAVEEFRKALALAPNSARERLNYGLALLRAGKTAEGIAELRKVQKQDPSIPHTWFNLGIAYKKAGEQEDAIQQFEQIVKLVPDEPISHYNLGSLYRLAGRTDDAIREFRTASKLDPTLAAPHFQLFNLLRTSGRQDEAKPELESFQKLKKQQEGAAIPEDVEWCMYAEIYDVMTDTPAQDKVAELKFESRTGPAAPVVNPREVLVDYDHDYDLDRIALGPKPVLMRNQGPAGDQPAEFPFVEGEALSGATFRVVPDTKGFDILITYAAHNAVLYRDKLQGNYTAELIAVPQKATNVATADLNNDGWIDVVYAEQDGTHVAWNRNGKFEPAAAISSARSAFTFADLENRGTLDIVFGREVLRNNGKGTFTARQTELPAECASWSVGDFDSDGRTDLACGTKQFLNRTQTANSWIGSDDRRYQEYQDRRRIRNRSEGGKSVSEKDLCRRAAGLRLWARRSRPTQCVSPGRTVSFRTKSSKQAASDTSTRKPSAYPDRVR